MLYYYLLFFFITVGAKFVLAFMTIYLLLPTDRRCGDCDEETLLLESSRLVRLVARLSPGRLQRRWCPRCGHEGFARPALRAGHTPERTTRTRTPTRH